MRIPPLRKFLSLPGNEQQILVNALFLLIIVRLGLWLLPFRTLQLMLERLLRAPVGYNKQSPSPEKVSWAVSAVSRYVPAATCLTQALTLQALLSRGGIHSALSIGVARDDTSRLIAHAWLEVDGAIVIGGQDRDRYTRLKRQE